MADIFIVDAQINVRRLIKNILIKEGHNVVTFATSEEALDSIKKSDRPDLMFLDLKMPNMNGFTFIETLEEIGCSFPIVVVTELDKPDMIRKAFLMGVCDYITKPFAPQELTEAFENCVRAEEGLQKRVRQIKKMLKDEKISKATKEIRRLIRDFPDSPYPHYLLSLTSGEDKKIKHLKAALALDENFREAKELLEK
ncbi:MAG: response regulator [Kosmotogaceae bacterium]